MARTANDSWDIATSVGATAVMVALARASMSGLRWLTGRPPP